MPRPRRPVILLAIALLALLGTAALGHRQARKLRDQASEVDRHVLVPSPMAARVLAMGYTELAADLTWVRMLVYYGDGLFHNTGMPDTEALVRLVTTLDPTFRYAYLWGAYSVLYRNRYPTQEEYRSSVEILRRALAQFPDDWEFSWTLGMRLFFDLKPKDPAELEKNKEEGTALIERAMHLPNAPKDLPFLAATMRSKLGQKTRALHDLREMILSTEDPNARAELENRYAALVSETASNELAEAAKAFDAEWKATFSYAPATFFILVGKPPYPAIDLRALLLSQEFESGTSLAPSPGE
jgi:hypothetical protein